MTNLPRTTRRVANGLMISGAITLVLAMTALAFPEPTLISGMMFVGLLSALVGSIQIVTSLWIRSETRQWRLLLGHGLLAATYGVLTVGASAMTFGLTVLTVGAWLLCHGALAVRLATHTSVRRSLRRALLVVASVDTTIAILAITLRTITIFQFLFFGAVYAVVYGATQLVGGISLRRTGLSDSLESHAGELSRLPSF